MAGIKPETAFDLEKLFVDLNRSFTKAAIELRNTFESPEWKDSPYVYHMPKMHLSMKLVLSYSGGTVKGVFNKERTDQAQELTSTVDIDVVALPRQSRPGTPSQ